MINARRRLVARLLLPIVAVWLAVMPYREARALLPFVVPIAIAGLDAAGAVVVSNMVSAAATALIGGTIVALAITPKDAGTGSDLVPIRIPTSTSAGSTSVMAPTGTAPSTSAIVYLYTYVVGGKSGQASTALAACSAAIAQIAGGGGAYLSGGTGGSNCWYYIDGAGPYGNVAPTVYQSCDPGYVMGSGVCNLSDVRAAGADGRQDVTRSGTALTKPTDADSSPAPMAIQTTTSTNDTAVVSGKDDQGRPVRVSVQATSDGGSLVTVSTQKTDANGGTYLDNRITQIAASGAVSSGANTSTGQRVVYNTVTGVYDTAAATSTANPAATGTGAGSEPIVFPSDYARAGEAASAAQSMSNTLGPKIDAITNTGDDPVDPLLPEESIFNDAFFSGTFNNLLGWQLPAHSSECPTGSFAWNGGTYAIDSHCQLINSHFGTLSAAMAVVWTVAALFLVLRA